MARELNRLTALEVKSAKPSDTPNTPRLLSDGGGLYLQVSPQGARSYLFRYTFQGKAKTLGLGAAHTISLADARVAAQNCRVLVSQGIDPKVQRERDKAQRGLDSARSFAWCAEQYIQAHEKDWKNAKHVHQWRQSLEDYAFPVVGEMPVNEVDVHHVLAVLEPIWRKKTETAVRLRGRIERILGWASIKGYRAVENPARWRAYLSELLPNPSKVSPITHHPAVPHKEIADFVSHLRRSTDCMSRRALEFLVLTAARTGEVIGARWEEIDFDSGVWTVPAERMKAQRAHAVPLSPAALTILKAIPRIPDEPFVFRGVRHGRHISNMAMLQIMRRMKLKAVPHGMRSTFRDWAADMTDFPREIAEAALAHAVGDKSEASYLRSNRLEKRREMMVLWSQYCGYTS